VSFPPPIPRERTYSLSAHRSAQALSRLSAAATAQQRREVEQLAGALFEEQQAPQVRQGLLDEGRSVIDRTRTATEQHAAEIAKLNELLNAGTIDQATAPGSERGEGPRAALEPGVDRRRHEVPEGLGGREPPGRGHRHRARLRDCLSGAEDSLVGFIASGKLKFQGLVDSVLADLARMTVRQTITVPLANALQSAFAGRGLFRLFHEGGIVGERPLAVPYADGAVFEHPPRYHAGGFAGSGLLPDEVPIIARRGELVVPPERVVLEEKTAREQRPITEALHGRPGAGGPLRQSGRRRCPAMPPRRSRASPSRMSATGRWRRSGPTAGFRRLSRHGLDARPLRKLRPARA
jgi:hypothetical protein